MKIAICDDNPRENAYLKRLIKENFEDCSISQHYDGPGLLSFLENNEPDIALLDIEMPGISGIEIGKRLRSKYSNLGIIFITAHPQFALEAFGMYALDYLIKPIDKERLVKSINMLIRQNAESIKYVNIRNRGLLFRIKQNDIIFIEKVLNKCIIYTEKFTYSMIAPLKYFENIIDKSIFIKTHTAFLVNQLKIRSVEFRGNLSYDICFYGTDKKAIISRGMNEKLKLIKKEKSILELSSER